MRGPLKKLIDAKDVPPPVSSRKRGTKYTNVGVPTELVDAVREVVNAPKSFYTSMADFVKEALREKLERIHSTKAQ